MNSAFFLVLKSPLYYTNRGVSITVFSDTLIHNIGYIFEYHILTLIFRLDTKLHCLFLQITSEMTNKNLTILLIDNLFFGFSAYKSYSLKLMHMKLFSWFITIKSTTHISSHQLLIDTTLKALDLMLMLSHDCSCFCHNNISFDCTISKNNLLFPSSSLMREEKLVSKIQNPLLIPHLNFISQLRDIRKHNLRMTQQDIFSL